MNAQTKLNQMTANELRARINEISEELRRHESRNLEEELAEVMRKGGDIDKVETAQLEYERIGRRLRVELSLREKELPEAVKREAEEDLQDFIIEHQALEDCIRPVADEAVESLIKLIAAGKKFIELNTEATNLTEKARELARRTGADVPMLGTFRKRKLAELCTEFQQTDKTLRYCAAQGMTVLYQPVGKDLDPD